MSPAGVSAAYPAGVSAYGVSPAGVGADGVSPAGVGADGVSPAGVGADGVSPAGVGADGVSPAGVGADCVSPAGLSAAYPAGVSATHQFQTSVSTHQEVLGFAEGISLRGWLTGKQRAGTAVTDRQESEGGSGRGVPEADGAFQDERSPCV